MRSLPVLCALLLSACAGHPAPALDRVETWQGTLTPLTAATPQTWRLNLRDNADGYSGEAYRLEGTNATLVGPALVYPYGGKYFITVNLQQGQHRLLLSRAGNILAGAWEQKGRDGGVDLAGHAHFDLLNTHEETPR
ncbi:hypothetical protein [Deinococcus hopiensis]|nr:hypothetical protein [Deinococcus hopiensis]